MTGDRDERRLHDASPPTRRARRRLSPLVAVVLAAVGTVTACGQEPSQRAGNGSVVLEAGGEPPAAGGPAVRVLRLGASGVDVENLQRRLASLGYWLGEPDGTYGTLTEQAVLALQKTAGVRPDGVFGRRTRAALDEGVQPQPRRTVGSGVEVDLRRQVLMHVSEGVPTLVLNTSTGSGATYRQDGIEQVAVTPTGRHTVFRQVDGRDVGPLGDLWRPKYIVGGVAIHGYPSVPAVPASHGCVRVSLAAMDHLWVSGLLPVGSSVWVY